MKEVDPMWMSIVDHSGVVPLESDLTDFESVIGYRLPEDYRSFLLMSNGGTVSIEHEIELLSEGEGEVVAVSSLDSFYSPPRGGVREERFRQKCNLVDIGRVMTIGDDGCAIFFYLVLGGKERGSVYCAYKTDRLIFSRKVWDDINAEIPDYMMFVCSCFDDLGGLILKGRV